MIGSIEQERQIVHDLNNALAEIDRAYAVCQTNLNRYRAAKLLAENLATRLENSRSTATDLDRLLDAQRRLADAESRVFLATTEYEMAIKNFYFEKGAILEYHQLAVLDAAPISKSDLRSRSRSMGSTQPRRTIEQTAELEQKPAIREQAQEESAVVVEKDKV